MITLILTKVTMGKYINMFYVYLYQIKKKRKRAMVFEFSYGVCWMTEL